MIKVSIVIPMYNEQKYIDRCLNSIVLQTYKDFEVILIDDGSKDNTIKIAETYKDKLDLKILNQIHGGPGKARNLGAGISNGDILVFVDADMKFDNMFIEELINPILNGTEIGTAHGVEMIGNPENKLARAWCLNRIENPKPRSGVYRAIIKKVFLDNGGFSPEKGYFDDDLSKINNGLGALTVMSAICYHNNPEHIGEIFKHSEWVGKSLAQTGYIKNYIKTYIYWIISFTVLSLGLCSYMIYKGLFIYSLLSFLLLIIFLVLVKSIIKSIKEKYLSHIFFVPIVIITRGVGYISGFIKYLGNIK